MKLIKENIFLLSTLLVLVLYSFTLAPSVVQIDSGELATVQYTLGIAHPTGYPLFTIIGYLFLNIPLGLRKITQANLLAAIWCSFSIYFFAKAVYLLMNNYNLNKKDQVKKNKKSVNQISFSDDQKLISVIAGSFFLAFSKTFWLQSTSVEVYSLQTFLFSIIIYFILRAYFSKEIKNWFYVGLSFVLGFANHMTTLLVIPFAATLFFYKEKFSSNSIKIIVKTILISLPFLIIIYFYLPIRAIQNPIMNWGNPINFENFWRHFTGKQYQVWMFASLDAAKKQLGYYLSNFPSEFTFVGLIIGVIGLIYLSKTNRNIFIATLFTFLFSVLYTINYDIVDIDSYFLLSYLIFSIWIVFGFVYLYEKLSKRLRNNNYIIPIFVLVIFIPFVTNKNNASQNDIYIFEDYTKTILNGVEKNSIILSYQWDYFISASYYFQYVENFRKDVVVIDKELLRRSWYYNQIKRNHSEVFNKIKNEAENFVESVKPFERNENYNANILEQNYQAVMTNLITKNIDERNCYLGLELVQNEMQRGEFNLPQDYSLVPVNFLFKVVKSKNYVEAPLPNFKLRFPKESNKYIEFIRTSVATMLVYRAVYEIQFNKIERAKIYLEKVRKEFPEFNIPSEILNSVGM
ncbi:DUF2723 domain-containing protein [Stygiobacter electus]|jgi:hypothetical protein|uniref:DUF2723 domain-containing protein n=1 Tax=Stygiobacter electus TaxID=3032292 RepID=A0AAE3P2G7_9BACT|nr:DUF2723 domain-containing protein [Stygiobacter electus]MDF1613010.1 DUF2723 domain-containing protein [Stygiobacter electus]